MKTLYTTLILLIPFLSNAQDRQSDSLALVQIYNDMGGPDWTNSEGWLTTLPLEEWNGIKTNGNRVEELRLFSIGVNGVLSEAIYELTALISLEIFNGTVTGEISDKITNLSELRTLALSRIGLTGSIPNLDSFSNLSNIRLNENGFSGNLPDIPASVSLLWLHGNNLTGTIPESWMNNEMTVLNISINELEGTLDILSTLTSIRGLDIAVNNWDESQLPYWLDELPSLVNFFGSEANFTGDIPEYDFSNSPNFRQILINDNTLTGDISNLLNGVLQPMWIDAKKNLFDGELPIDKFQSVFRFDLSNNKYSSIADPNAPIVSEITLSSNGFRVSTLLPHFNELHIDSLEKLVYNNQEDLYPELDTTLTTPQIYILDAGDTYEGILYQWIKNNQPIEGETERYLEVDATEMSNLIGRYNCIMTHPDLTTNQGNLVEFERGIIEIHTDFVSSTIEDISQMASIYPNPTRDMINITSQKDIKGSKYQLISQLGKLIKTGIIQSDEMVELKDVKPGILYLQIITSEGKITKKIIKL